MKPIIFSQHALDQLNDRGATRAEVKEAIRKGERIPAKKGRTGFRKNFPYNGSWKKKFYATKQVISITTEEPGSLIVVTVFVFYFGDKP